MLAAARRFPLSEALPALGLLVVAAGAVGLRPVLLGFIWLAVVTPRLLAVDLAEHRLPDAVVLPGYPIVLTGVLLGASASGGSVTEVVIAGLACGLVFLLLHIIGGMGLGDVKLAPLLGALAAAAAPGGAVIWLVLAFLVGGAGALVVLIRHGTGARMAFGPPMLLGAWAAVLVPGLV